MRGTTVWGLVGVLLAHAACGDGGDGGGDGASADASPATADAASPPDAAGPPRQLADAAPPSFPEICLDGWCFENPLPTGPVASVWSAGPSDLWLALPHVVLRFDGQTIDFTHAASGFRFLDGTAPDDLWARQGPLLWRFDGTTWAQHTPPFFPSVFAAHAPGDAWSAGVFGAAPALAHHDGATWTTVALPAELVPVGDDTVTIDAIAASGPGALWLTAHVVTGAAPNQVHRELLARLDGGTWTVEDLGVLTGQGALFVLDARAIRAFVADDVWIASDLATHHFDGTAWVTIDGGADRLVGLTPDDLWATSFSTTRHWDGAGWSGVAGSLAIYGRLEPATGVRDQLWAVDSGGDLFFSDGSGWDRVTRRPLTGELRAIAAAPRAGGGEDLWVLGTRSSTDFLARRDASGAWMVDPTISAGAGELIGLFARTSDDLWTLGYKAFHYDGSTWALTSTPGAPGVTPYFTQICSYAGDHAYAVGPAAGSGVYRWDGALWQFLGGRGGRLQCLSDGQIWTIDGAGVEALGANGWQGYVKAPHWGAFAAVTPGRLWTTLGDHGVFEFDGAWRRASTQGLALPSTATPYFLDVTAASATELTFIVQQNASTYSLVRHDGQDFGQVLAPPGPRPPAWVRALGPDDLLVVDIRFGTYRLQGGTTTTLFAGFTGATEPATGVPPSGAAYFASASGGWATDLQGRVLSFDGATWVVDATCPLTMAADLVGFAMDDLWVVGLIGAQAVVAHHDGLTWTTTPIGGSAGPLGIHGASATDLWVFHGDTVFRNAGGSFAAVVLPGDEGARPFEGIAGSGPDDVWLYGTHFLCSTGHTAVYHWDGVAFARYTILDAVGALRLLDDKVLALDHHTTCSGNVTTSTPRVLEHSPSGWIVRTDLDPATIFPPAPPDPPPAPIDGPTATAGSGPYFTIGASSVIVRHD